MSTITSQPPLVTICANQVSFVGMLEASYLALMTSSQQPTLLTDFRSDLGETPSQFMVYASTPDLPVLMTGAQTAMLHWNDLAT